ncbi:MAG: ROK family protein [Balneola sp.]|nr:MAG: ROK family protein [Balneola sp.]
MKAVAIDLGGTNIKTAVVDSNEGIIEQTSTPTHADLGRDHLLDRIAGTIEELTKKDDVVGIGLGLPGMINNEQTTVLQAPNLPGWDNVNAADEITSRTGLPCRIENDANIGALGSLHFGVGQKYDSFVMITLGTGVGGGIIYNRKLFKGTQGMAAELGHVIIDYHGPLSNSVTRGTIEAYIGQRFLSRFASDMIIQNPDNNLYRKFHNNFDKLEPVDLTQEANLGNELAIEILQKTGQRLGYAIINYTHILDIRKYVLSGGVSKAGKWLFDPAREVVKKHMMAPFQEGFELVYEDLGNDSSLLGAAGLAFDSFA